MTINRNGYPIGPRAKTLIELIWSRAVRRATCAVFVIAVAGGWDACSFLAPCDFTPRGQQSLRICPGPDL